MVTGRAFACYIKVLKAAELGYVLSVADAVLLLDQRLVGSKLILCTGKRLECRARLHLEGRNYGLLSQKLQVVLGSQRERSFGAKQGIGTTVVDFVQLDFDRKERLAMRTVRLLKRK